MVSLKQKTKKMEKLMSINVGNANLQEKLGMKIMILIGIIILLSSCGKVDMDGFDPATSTFKWIIERGNK
jgi:hypothetical protein|tara:strand:+ start:370 stop:579 length:210 start_codon:yes stop_codon:yes gene_type:complete